MLLHRNTLTGGSFNPARSLGSAIFANVWSHHYIFWIGPLVGATLAGVFYRYEMDFLGTELYFLALILFLDLYGVQMSIILPIINNKIYS